MDTVGNYHLLDVARVNAQTIAEADGNKNLSSFEFGWDLVKALTEPTMESRSHVGGLQSELQKSIYQMVQKDAPDAAGPAHRPMQRMSM